MGVQLWRQKSNQKSIAMHGLSPLLFHLGSCFFFCSVSFTPSLAAWNKFCSLISNQAQPLLCMSVLRSCRARGLQAEGFLVLGCLWSTPFPDTSSWTPSPTIRCLLLMPHPYSVLWSVPSLGTYQEQGTCAFLISGTTKPIPWATLNKSLENWADIPIAPNQCQPGPPCLSLSLYWVVLSSCHWGILWLFICFASCCPGHLFPPLIVLSVTFLGDAMFLFLKIGIGDLLELLIFLFAKKTLIIIAETSQKLLVYTF